MSQTTKMIIFGLRKAKDNLLNSPQFSYSVNWGNSLGEHSKENRKQHENKDYLLYTDHSHKPQENEIPFKFSLFGIQENRIPLI
jgi:hypothetical protein